jgi:rubrerythrin
MKIPWTMALMPAGMVLCMLVPAPAIAEDGATIVALEIAHGRECNARLQYLAYADRADREGYGPIATLFRVVARAESVHAVNHEIVIAQLGGRPQWRAEVFTVRSTAENLRASVVTELGERSKLYPRFAEYARAECLYDALASMNYACGAEATHARFFSEALATLELASASPGTTASTRMLASMGGTEQPFLSWLALPPTFYVCSGDGSVFASPVKRCPNCGTGGSKFWSMTGQPAVPPALAVVSEPVTLAK